MLNIILRLIILTAGIFLASYLVPGVNVEGYGPAIKAAVLLGVMNLIIKPVLIVLTLPINILTLGLFTLVLNGLILWAVGWLISGFAIAGFLPALVGALVISLLSIVLNRFV
ncbi:MAG: phage holin family protein [Deltaproteobacteria bacterium]|nr:phage holin family protein [Deltaproteobacteria bacterium]MBZ0220636.1 phage holin family protein [Deltaproteobacteria bacterium]